MTKIVRVAPVVPVGDLTPEARLALGLPGARRRALRQEEHEQQRRFFQEVRCWEERHPVLTLVFAVPNGARTGSKQARKLKAEGMRAGIADVICLAPQASFSRDRYTGWVAEFKRPDGTGRLSKAQREWLTAVAAAGARVLREVTSWRTAWNDLVAYLGLPHELDVNPDPEAPDVRGCPASQRRVG